MQLDLICKVFKKEIGDTAEGLTISYEPIGESEEARLPISEDSFSRIATVVRLYPNGIVSMNGSIEGVVESSDNIGIISTDESSLKLVSEIRGGHMSSIDSIMKTIETIGMFFGATIDSFDPYDPWEFAPDSELRTIAADKYRELFGEDMKLLALHAGLECAPFSKAIPDMDIISIGPDCQYFHSPQERVSISSTEKSYMYLTALLAEL